MDFIFRQLILLGGVSPGNYTERLVYFEQTANLIDSYTMNNKSNYTIALNEMAVWLPNEILTRFRPFPKQSRANMTSYKCKLLDSAPSSIDWSTSNNPISKSVVPTIKNQGMCGSCWAFTAVAMTEASIFINQKVNPTSLSVQELIDCDNKYNFGCGGGDPNLAFNYIQKNGLTSWLFYPYTARDNSCQRDKSKDSSGVIGSHLNLGTVTQSILLKYVALSPVSIGICASDFEFMYYSGGIFDLSSCCTNLDHAMLLVGYGYDSTKAVSYWVLQNSWSSSWGESGYMRILRTSDEGQGLCGLTSSPSIVLGGSSVGNKEKAGHSSIFEDRKADLKEWILYNEDWILSLTTLIAFICLVCCIYSFCLNCLRKTCFSTKNNYYLASTSPQR